MRTALRTPGLQSVLGRTIALITVVGRRSGRHYTTPVTYYRSGDTVTIVTKRIRQWWRNLQTNPELQLRLAGTDYRAGVDYLQFIYPGIIAVTVLTTSLMAGVSVVADREYGFEREILVAPLSPTGIVLGKAGGTTLQGLQIGSSRSSSWRGASSR